MTSYISATQGLIYPLCEKEVLIGRQNRSDDIILTQVTSCCGIFKATHYNYALKFSKLVD